LADEYQSFNGDVTGIKLGMSPADARPVLQARKFTFYKEYTNTLGYGNGAIAGTEFLAGIRANTLGRNANTDASESYELLFGPPIDGQSRLYKLTRSVRLAGGQELLKSVFIASLIEKYGKPVFSDDMRLEWFTTGVSKPKCLPPESEAMNYQPEVNRSQPTSISSPFIQIGTGFDPARPCGDLLIVSLSIKGGTPNASPNALINLYTEILYSPSLVVKSASVAQAAINTAADSASHAAAARAQQQKPSL
jgi:hypothetical protein